MKTNIRNSRIDGEDVQESIDIRKFSGMAPSADPAESTPGHSVHQVNISAGFPGEIRVRLGCRVVRFS